MKSLADQVDAVLFTGSSSGNLIINGAMQVTQRSAVGTAVTGITTSGYYTADRFQTLINTLGTWSQTTIADAPTGSGFRNCVKLDCTTADASPAAGDYLIFRQQIEGQNLQAIRKGTASAQTLTLSFWVKSFQTGTFIVELEDSDNNRGCSKSYTVNVSNVWEYKTVTYPADVTGVFDNDANSSCAVNFWLGAGTTYTSGTLATTWGTLTSANRAVGQINVASATTGEWFMTGAQLTVGSVATPFEFKSFGDDLRACLRYFWRHLGRTNDTNITTGLIYTGNLVLAPIFFPVPARSNAPTVTASSGTALEIVYGTGVFGTTAIAFGDTSNYTAQAAITIAGGTAGQAGLVRMAGSTDYIQMSDEL
jgi:hypothetical protein